MRLKAIVLAISFFATGTTCAQATFIQFDDRLTFETATSSTTTETFNAYVSNVNLVGATEDVGPFTMDGTAINGISLIETDGSASFNVDGTAFWRGIGTTGSMVFNFDTAITAFGVDLFGINNSVERTQISIGAETFYLPVVDASIASFFGVTSDIAFTTISFNLLQGEDAGIDNVTFGSAPVPEPVTLLLFGTGILGLAGSRIRRKKE